MVVVFGFYQVYLHVIASHGTDRLCGSTILEILNFLSKCIYIFCDSLICDLLSCFAMKGRTSSFKWLSPSKGLDGDDVISVDQLNF